MSFTILKKNPTRSEQRTSLINSSDGAGLHFDGSAGHVEATALSFSDATQYSFEVVFSTEDATTSCVLIGNSNSSTTRKVLGFKDGILRLGYKEASWAAVSGGTIEANKVYHVVATRDGTTQKIYINGNEVTSGTLDAIYFGATAAMRLAYSGDASDKQHFGGTIYRARVYNKALTSTEVQTAFERADVPKVDQYGDAANLLLGVDKTLATAAANTTAFNAAYGWQSTASTSTVVASNVLTITSNAGGGIYKQVYRNGKNVRFTLNVTAISGTWRFLPSAGSDATDITTTGIKHLTALQTDNEVRFYSNSAGASISIDASSDNLDLVSVGAVADLDLAFANPTQSLTIQNRAGLPDGTASSSTAVTQVQPIIQGNLKSLAVGSAGLPAGVPADNHVFIGDTTATPIDGADDLVIARGSNDAGITIKTGTSNTGQICFADGTSADAFAGYIGYVHGATGQMNFGAGSDTRMSIASTGRVDTVAANNGDWSFKSQNTHASGFGALIVAGGSTASQTAFEVRHTGNTGSGTTALKIDGTGLCTFSNGIAFSQTDASGTGITSGAATLNHYETGTWTPVLSGTTATIGGAYALGTYTRIGNLCYVGWYSGSMTLASSSGSAIITGLPFPVLSEYKAYSPFSYQFGNAVDGNSRGGYFPIGTSQVNFVDDGGTAGATYVDGTGKYIMMSGVYKVA